MRAEWRSLLLQRRAGVGLAGLTVYAMPLFAAVYGWIFMGERLHSYHVGGMMLVFLGIWHASRPVRRSAVTH